MVPALVAQGIERLPPEQKVVGSNPIEGTTAGRHGSSRHSTTGSAQHGTDACTREPRTVTAPRRKINLVASLMLLGAAVLALGQVPAMESWVAVCAIVSLVVVVTALVLAVRQMVTHPPRSRGPRR